MGEAKKYYPLFGLGANVALIFSGLYVRKVSGLRRVWMASGAAIDPWGRSLQYLMGGVCAAGIVLLACFRYLTTQVLTDPECMDQVAVKKAKTKTCLLYTSPSPRD